MWSLICVASPPVCDFLVLDQLGIGSQWGGGQGSFCGGENTQHTASIE